MTDRDPFADRRRQLQEAGLDRDDLVDDPVEQFRRWYDEAVATGLHEPDAMVVATVAEDGLPSARHVLCKGVDHGLVFFTNYDSRKGRELEATPKAAICFPWNVLSRQVRAAGPVERVTVAESDAYFASRPRQAQEGAWASHQSEVIADRAVLEARMADTERRFAGVDVPRPPHWGGYRVLPVEWEFWQGRPARLHDRFRYVADAEQPTGWRVERLSP